jgi:predicted ABC-type transport system involved in lysophospholipase L1 biosynthesis ATPase subunit
MNLDPRDEANSEEMQTLARAFTEQLLACLDECARGRKGLFSENLNDEDEDPWPEAARLRELAVAMQAIFAQLEERNALCDEFLDLCTIHGESHPGERKLARAFLERIERGDVGSPTQEERKPW